MTPLKECLNCLERRAGPARVLLAHGQRPCQHTELPDLSRRPLDAPARRKAPIRELRHISL
jgi:hypothetical protein